MLSERDQRRKLKYFDILKAKEAYENGENVSAFLRAQNDAPISISAIIEIVYDLQAGTYIEVVEEHIDFELRVAEEFARIIETYVGEKDVLLDVGTGEITMLSLVARALKLKPFHIYAFDISWSRIFKGIDFAKNHMGDSIDNFTPFVADINEIPFLDKSIDVTISNHALEPNGGRLLELLAELFRITRDTLLLFEPCYEINSREGKERMDSLGYIKGMDEAVNKLGGKLIKKINIAHVRNTLNPTACFIIKPPTSSLHSLTTNKAAIMSVPGSNHILEKIDNFYFSNTTGLCFPIIKNIPILKSGAAILATSLIRS
jgi:ubiquinone/menaquinone biosynthesis C-methylase UbiE